jgi:hypothetical protein
MAVPSIPEIPDESLGGAWERVKASLIETGDGPPNVVIPGVAKRRSRTQGRVNGFGTATWVPDSLYEASGMTAAGEAEACPYGRMAQT